MIGTHSVPVVVDAYRKGFRGFDAKKAYAAVRDSLRNTHDRRGFEHWDVLDKYGYYPFDIVRTESVSRTLEHAYDDWCAARFAEALGEKDDMKFFDARSHSWTNVFDTTLCLARGRDSNGQWRDPFNPFKLNVGDRGFGAKDFTEGNSWQYSWHVMQHPELFVKLHGGKEKFAEHLETLFNLPEKAEGMDFALDATGLIGQYAHGNEPSHHTIYFFQYAGRGDRTAELVREVCDRFYMPEPDGLCGNDDCGQMSAWYLFSAMGFYPFNPCGGDYVLGAPQFPKITVSLPAGKKLVITAKNLSKSNKYVRSVTFNGKRVKGFILKHADLMAGGELVFEMRGPDENTKELVRSETLPGTGAEISCDRAVPAELQQGMRPYPEDRMILAWVRQDWHGSAETVDTDDPSSRRPNLDVSDCFTNKTGMAGSRVRLAFEKVLRFGGAASRTRRNSAPWTDRASQMSFRFSACAACP